jgi:hypothetical protein
MPTRSPSLHELIGGPRSAIIGGPPLSDHRPARWPIGHTRDPGGCLLHTCAASTARPARPACSARVDRAVVPVRCRCVAWPGGHHPGSLSARHRPGRHPPSGFDPTDPNAYDPAAWAPYDEAVQAAQADGMKQPRRLFRCARGLPGRRQAAPRLYVPGCRSLPAHRPARHDDHQPARRDQGALNRPGPIATAFVSAQRAPLAAYFLRPSVMLRLSASLTRAPTPGSLPSKSIV